MTSGRAPKLCDRAVTLTGSGSTTSILPFHHNLQSATGLTGPYVAISHSSISPVRTHFGSESGLSRSKYVVKVIVAGVVLR